MLLPDQLLPAYQYSERHCCRIVADPGTVLDVAEAYRPDSDSLIRAAIYLRERLGRLGQQIDASRDPFGMDSFTRLGRSPSFLFLGLIGAFWRLDYGLRQIADAEAFTAYNAADAAKLLMFFQVLVCDDGRTELVTETRIFCPDRASYLKFMPYWLLIRPVSGLIRRRTLAAIKRCCESGGRSGLSAD